MENLKRRKILTLFLYCVMILLFGLFSFQVKANAHTLIRNSAGIDVVRQGTETDSKYSFTFKSSGNTRFEPWGYSGLTRDFFGGQASLAMMPANDNLSGKIGCWIYNAGNYKGNPVDVKCTYYWKPLTVSGTHINPFIYVVKDARGTINFCFSQRAYEVKYEIYSEGKPITVDMCLNFQDIDARQFFGFKFNDGKLNKIQVRNDATSYYRKQNGYHWVYAPSIASNDTPESSVRIELDSVQSFNIIYGSEMDVWSYPIDCFKPTVSEATNWVLQQQKAKENVMKNNIDPNSASGGGFGWALFNASAYGPYTIDTPTKTITDTNENNIKENTLGQNETFTYNISTFVPLESSDYYYSSFMIKDVLPQYVTYKSAKIYDETNTDITSKFTVKQDGQTITATLKSPDSSSFYGNNYRMEIKVILKSDIIHSENFKFNNTASIVVNRGGKTTTKNSNTVTSNYPIVERKIVKLWDDLDDADGLRKPVIVNLKNNTENKTIKNITLTQDNSWQQTVSDLPKYTKDGKLIDYSFEEIVPTGYTKNSQTVSGITTTILNYHYWTRTTATVSKVWNDLNDADGIRPNEVTVALKANGVIVPEYSNIKLNEGNNWTATVTEIPMNKKGQKINYTFEEVVVPSGYKVASNITTGTKTVITNFHEWKKTDLKANKVWLDGNNADGFRPFRIELELTANGEVLQKDLFLSEANNWTYETKQLPLNKKGVRIDYQFHEKDVPSEYTVSYDKRDVETVGVTTKTNTTIMNTHDYGEVSVRAEKYWIDENNADGLRPDSVEVQLLADEKVLNTYTLDESNHWSVTVNDLPKELDGKVIQYTFKEVNTPEGYTVNYETKDNVTRITNKHIHEVKALSVQKHWKDGNNADGLRPSYIEVELLANGKAIEEFTLSKGNDWKAEIYNLPVKEQGNVINYEFQEKAIPKGYTVNYEVKDNHTVITNIHEIETTEVQVEKIWRDGNNADNLRPESVEVELFANESKVGTYILTAQENWELTVSDLPVKTNGENLTYRFKEKGIIKGYEVNYQQDGNKTIITNTHEIERTSATVKHIWQDENDIEGFRPKEVTVVLYGNNEPAMDENKNPIEVVLSDKINWEYKLNHLPKNEKGQPIQYRFVLKESIPRYTSTAEYEDDRNHSIITSVHVPELVTLELEKTWNDSNNADGLRPSNIQVDLKQNGVNFKELTLNEDNNWQLEINDLPKYREGKELEYTFKEKTVPTGYEVSYKTVGNKTVITNTHEQERINLEVQKEWNDNNNQDGLRPTEIVVKLYANENELKEFKLNNKNDWSVTVENLPKNENGIAIQYRFEETVIPEGYEVQYETTNNKTVITNIHEVGKTAVMIQKIWDDKNNQDGIRPKKIEVELLANGKELQTITLDEQNNWQTVIRNLPLKENGMIIDYKVKEITQIAEYLTNVEQKGGLFEITNTHIPETVTAKVEKYWQDENDLDKLRPTEVEVVLIKNGKVTEQSLILSEENNWKDEISDLPKYENGEEIKYSYQLKESIPEYTTSYHQSGNITQITSVHKIPKVNLTVSKIWNDENNADGLRPQNIEVGFYVNGIQQQIIELNELNDWTATMSNLRQFINGKEVHYEFVELTKVEGYTTETVVQNNETVITNTHIPEKTTAKVEKVWIDNNNADGLRPTEVEVVLFKNGKPTDKTLILSEENNWKGQIDNLIKNENGVEIKYSYQLKDSVPEYTTTSEQMENLTKITSVHDSIKTEASVQKIWKDNNSSKRPESITVVLYKNGKPTEKQVILNKENNWQATISDLLKYENSKEIVYTFVEEDVPEGYSNSTELVDGVTVITNTLERPVIDNPDTPDEPDIPSKQSEQITKETVTKEQTKTDGTATPVKTSDVTNVIVLFGLLGLGVLGIVIKKHKK